MNEDNKPDIITTNAGSKTIGIYLNNGGGIFALPINYSTGNEPQHLVAADVNGDSKVDIIVANRLANNIGVFLNNGNAMFASQVTYSTGVYGPIWVTAADVNADNRVDLIVMNTGTGSNIVNVLLSACI